MSKIIPTIWPLDPHTGAAKHLILRHYISAWLPIISQMFNHALFIDGFCGPGAYSKGEPGSPIIAISEAIKAIQQTPKPKAGFVLEMFFIDADDDRIENLKFEMIDLPTDSRIVAHTPQTATFEEALPRILSGIKSSNSLVPTFAFIDPFGVKGCSLRSIREILSRPSSEVFMLFDVDGVNRLLHDQNMMKEVFGEAAYAEAAQIASIPDTGVRYDRIRALHQKVIKKLDCGCKFYLPFKIQATSRKELYDLIFLTNHAKGFEKMKEAMWKVDTTGAFHFVDANYASMELDLSVWKKELWQLLISKFRNKTVSGLEVNKYVMEQTRFLSKHKKEVLEEHEDNGVPMAERIKATNRKSGYPDRCQIQFPA